MRLVLLVVQAQLAELVHKVIKVYKEMLGRLDLPAVLARKVIKVFKEM